MKSNKGVSIISLIIVIVVTIILASVALNAGNLDINKAQEAKKRAERNQVIQAIGARYGSYNVNGTASPLVGDKIPSELSTPDEIKSYLITMFKSENRMLSEDEAINHTIENEIDSFLEKNEDQMDFTRILRHSDIINLGLDNISLGSVFLINYYTATVVGPID